MSDRLKNRVGDVIVNVLASSAVDHGFEPQSGQTNDYKIVMSCFSAKHASLRRNSKDCLQGQITQNAPIILSAPP